jgi:penicillin amidase
MDPSASADGIPSRPDSAAAAAQEDVGNVLGPLDVNPAWIVFGVLSVVMGTGMIVIMSLLLSAQRRLECPGLAAIGGVFVPVGVALFIIGAIVLWCWSIQGPRGKPSRGRVACKVIALVLIAILYLAFVAICVVAAALYVASANVPEYRISREGAPGLTADVAIVRDENDIAHIEAATVEDALFAQGYVIALDRLAQLEVLRLASAGELAKHVGQSMLDLDKATRVAGFHLAGDTMCRLANESSRRLWQRYADGINFYLESDANRPLEFMALGVYLTFHEPAPYQLRDLCRIVKLLQFLLDQGVSAELDKWLLFADVGLSYDEVFDMFPKVFPDEDSVFTNAQTGYNDNDTAARQAREARDMDIERQLYETVMRRFRNNETATKGNGDFSSGSRRQGGSTTSAQSGTTADDGGRRPGGVRGFLKRLGNGGSNAWAARSANGSVVVATDPHLPSMLPALWYPFFARITDGSGFRFGGTGLPGLPGVILGRNADVAWGITISFTDLGDLYVMEPDPSRPDTHYMHNGTSKAYTTRREVIDVRRGDAVVIDVKESIYGPDIAEAWELSTRHRICASSRVIEADPETMNALTNLVRPGAVTSVKEIRENVFAHVRSPGLSIVIGDRHGGVGYSLTGAHVVRAVGHTGRTVTYGNGSFDYVSNLPPEQLPGLDDTNTSTAANISSANYRIAPPGYPYTLGGELQPAYRGRAIKRYFDEMGPAQFSNSSQTRRMQTSEQSNLLRETLGPLFDSNSPIGARFESLMSPQGRQMLNTVRGWNQVATRGSYVVTQLWRFMRGVSRLNLPAIRKLEADAFDPATYSVHVIMSPTNITQRLCAAATNGGDCLRFAAEQWNIVASEKPQGWGTDYTRVDLRHIAAHGTVLQCAFSRETDKGGDDTSLNVLHSSSASSGDGVSTSTFIPSLRMVTDWNDPTQYDFALPGGPSGNPFSTSYTNLVERWSYNEYITVRIDGYKDAVRMYLKP